MKTISKSAKFLLLFVKNPFIMGLYSGIGGDGAWVNSSRLCPGRAEQEKPPSAPPSPPRFPGKENGSCASTATWGFGIWTSLWGFPNAARCPLGRLRGGYSLEDAFRHPVYPTLAFLTAPMNCPVEKIDTAAFGEMLSRARQMFDYVFLDAPAGVDAGFRLTAQFADRFLLVTGQAPPPCGTLPGWATCWS